MATKTQITIVEPLRLFDLDLSVEEQKDDRIHSRIQALFSKICGLPGIERKGFMLDFSGDKGLHFNGTHFSEEDLKQHKVWKPFIKIYAIAKRHGLGKKIEERLSPKAAAFAQESEQYQAPEPPKPNIVIRFLNFIEGINSQFVDKLSMARNTTTAVAGLTGATASAPHIAKMLLANGIMLIISGSILVLMSAIDLVRNLLDGDFKGALISLLNMVIYTAFAGFGLILM